ncbi:MULTISPECIES: hypothetical protein [unclassified Salinibacterium]|uniref:hypothetical protein n=1 Tax=unclassified Salinibacterium TaxID=2632331 RepID=UPI001CD20054|nr:MULTISPECIES: hypothetical protein [unclassified Salinibacterium]
MAKLVEKLAESVPNALGTKINYGEPITLDGVEAIPVSLVWFGFGGGSEADEEGREGGSGGGGGGASIPLGVYMTGPDGLPYFKPNTITFLAVSIPVIAAAGTAIAKIVKALKK